MKKIIHVNQHKIKSNRKNNVCEPVITVKTYKGTTYGKDIEIYGSARLVYRPDKPLACGAHVWLETRDKVIVDGKIIE